MSTSAEGTEPLRIGVLGAARITALSLVEPARLTGHRLVAVAARSPERAAAFAAEHGIERVLDSYRAVIEDPEVEAVYNPLPNAHHGHWNLAVATAGKHVLAEKPAAANADEMHAVAEAVRAAGVVWLEGFHYPYHPLFLRVRQIIASGGIGEVRHVDAPLWMPSPPDDDPRWSADLAGGSTMDLGCYSISCLRPLGEYAGGEPTLVDASATERDGHPGVDERLALEVEYPSGATGSGGSDMAYEGRNFQLTVTGSRGSIECPMFAVPSEDDTLVWRRTGSDAVVEHLGRRTSYTYQLEAFAAAVREGSPVVTDLDFSVATMTMIDRAYRLAGMEPRRAAS
ncbi:Gfo/Idh/MocA family protein [Phycicoccus sonneratiae]|uniref:Gfo/Idh/MocA family oxidoreductase n=1 Tax=Phycicoccus sonneratiae TaxID=2807628 RepID=A0ABS2CRW2_9MICO|nr:Gfo/Idh/MocA family oxidoreductase [Phycicoccus sonneraticus]MBM6402603.1 Gfo/Idh/MocA family oxidoreductase [Phycicoccus sonneraticus]